MSDLAEKDCLPYKSGESPLTESEAIALKPQVPEWQIIKREGIQQLERVYRFKNFAQALAFTNKIGALAEEQDHHPAILTEWGRVTLTWWTHFVNGLHTNDFIMAAKCDRLYQT
jgi:4a-hydroxytetrahydrobiopterin dehydratase